MADQSTNFTTSNGEYRNPFYQGTFEDETTEQMEHRLHWAAAAVEAERVVQNNKTAPQPVVQAEPAAWSGWGCQYPGKMPRLYGDRRIAELNCDWENGDRVLYFTAAPQPAPDAAQLAEALEELIDLMEDTRQGEYIPDSFTTQPARIALDVYHKKDRL